VSRKLHHHEGIQDPEVMVAALIRVGESHSRDASRIKMPLLVTETHTDGLIIKYQDVER
jgi:hypothetical protein